MRYVRRGTALLALIASAIARSQSIDLVVHNGFEDCWSTAITKPVFLQLLQSSVDGYTECVAQTTGSIVIVPFGSIDYTACYTPACPGGAIGCPIAVHAGAFGGDFSTGAFSAPGTADDVSVPVTYSNAIIGSGSCSIDVSNITLQFSPSFHVVPDGNSGDYMAYLAPASFVGVTGDNFSGSNVVCTTAVSTVGSQINGQAQALATQQMIDALNASAVGESVCPLTP
jgi:hypothetical protein